MRRRLAVLAGLVLPLALAAPATAHHIIVSPPGKDQPVHGPDEQWVGGGPLPEAAHGQGLVFSPGFNAMIPPSHELGLVQACLAHRANGNEVVAFAPPPFGTADLDCRHGGPPPP